jgi:transposase-like protein
VFRALIPSRSASFAFASSIPEAASVAQSTVTSGAQGAKTADLARKHGVSEATLYNWKAKYGGMDVPEAKRLRPVCTENLIRVDSVMESPKLAV